MSVTRANIEFAKRIFTDRLGDPYVYGGNWDPYNLKTGTDCSGLVGDALDAVNQGTAMPWRRSVSTESWGYDYANNRPVTPGTKGPKGTIAVASLADVPADAAVIVNIHHGGGGEDSHTQCVVDGVVMESNGDHGTCTSSTGAIDPNSTYWTDHWYLPGPIIEDGTPVTVIEPPDTLFADVSYYQAKVDDSYPYRVISIRSNDGTFVDPNFAANLAWCKKACDSGKLAAFLVYFVYRPDVDNVHAVAALVGDPHPQMGVEIDVESWGGQITGDQSSRLNATYDGLSSWLGDRRRVIAYGNAGDLNSLWPNKPAGLRIRLAAYGSNPDYPGKIAHQYTNGEGYGGGLPEGATPFGNCDMNSADNLTATAFAAALGITAGAMPTTPVTPNTPEANVDLHTSRSIYRTSNDRTMRGDDASLGADACGHMNWVEQCAIRGEQWALLLIKATANSGVGATKWWDVDAGNPNPGIDPWAIEKAKNVLLYIATINPTLLGASS